MVSRIARYRPSSPTVLALGLVVGLAVPPLAHLLRPFMPVFIFVFVLGAFLRVDVSEVRVAVSRPLYGLAVPFLVMLACPIVIGSALLWSPLAVEWQVALLLGLAAPPTSGTASIARMLGLSDAIAVTVILISMLVTPATVPAVAWLIAGYSVDPLALCRNLLILVGGPGLIAIAVRRLSPGLVRARGWEIDRLILGAMLLFVVGAMDGVQHMILAEPRTALGCIAAAFALNISLQVAGAVLLPGTREEKLTVGMLFGNRNVGLVWAALGASASPIAALFFAVAQLPIYLTPRAIAWILPRLRRSA